MKTLAAGVSVRPQSGDEDVQHDQPAQGDADPVLGQQEEDEVRRVEDGNLDVVDEGAAAELVRAPQGQLAGLVPGADQEVAGGDVLGEDVGVRRVEHLRRVDDEFDEEQQPQADEEQRRGEAGRHGGHPGRKAITTTIQDSTLAWARRGKEFPPAASYLPPGPWPADWGPCGFRPAECGTGASTPLVLFTW
jgi:hypothetical protein